VTIALEHLADNSVSDRNFKTLERLVIDTGGVSVFQRVIAGNISNAGAKNGGVGFTVSRTGVGVYPVVFSLPFPSFPVIQFGSDNGSPLGTFWLAGSATGFTAHVVNLAGTPVDAFINFTAIYQA
jgi:hypothetical protein